jgi:hypothetical protein
LPAVKPSSVVVLRAQRPFNLSLHVLSESGVLGVLAPIPTPNWLQFVTTFLVSRQQAFNIVTEILSNLPPALVVLVRTTPPSLARPTVLLKIVFKVLGKQLSLALTAGTE